MNYSDFQNALYEQTVGVTIEHQTICCGHVLTETSDGRILLNGGETLFLSLSEAQEYIKNRKEVYSALADVQKESYEDLPVDVVAGAIRKHHPDTRITDTLVESYMSLATERAFTSDDVVTDLRVANPTSSLLEGYIDYVLNDGSCVVVTENTQRIINSVLGETPEIIDYMGESRENFLEVFNQLEG